MLSNQILSSVQLIKEGGQSAPLLVSEMHACQIFELLYDSELDSLDELSERGITDLLYYDCSDKENEHHKANMVREQTVKMHQKPTGDILLAIFRNIEVLTETSTNALLHVFEDVPAHVLICVTSRSPGKIIPTVLSRMIIVDGETMIRGDNPLQNEIDDFVSGKPEGLFRMTLASSKDYKFSREDALWVIQGLQDALECGKIAPRHAKSIRTARIQLETTNTIAKYLIDQLLISLSCE